MILTPESLPEEEKSVTPPLEYGLVVGMSGSKTPQPETVEPEDECIDETVPVVEEEPTEEDGVIDVTLALEPFPGEERPLTPALEYGFVVGMSSSRIPQPETVEPEDECIDETVPVVEEEPTEEDGVIDVTLALEPFPGEERPVPPALEYGLVVGMSGSRIPQPETVEPEDECIQVTVPVVEEEPTEEDGVVDVTLALEPFPAEEKPVTPPLEYGLVVGMSGSRILQPETVEPEDECIQVTVPVVEEEPTEKHGVSEVILTPEPLPAVKRSVTPPLLPVVEEQLVNEMVPIEELLKPASEIDVTSPLQFGLVIGFSGAAPGKVMTVNPGEEILEAVVPAVEEKTTFVVVHGEETKRYEPDLEILTVDRALPSKGGFLSQFESFDEVYEIDAALDLNDTKRSVSLNEIGIIVDSLKSEFDNDDISRSVPSKHVVHSDEINNNEPAGCAPPSDVGHMERQKSLKEIAVLVDTIQSELTGVGEAISPKPSLKSYATTHVTKQKVFQKAIQSEYFGKRFEESEKEENICFKRKTEIMEFSCAKEMQTGKSQVNDEHDVISMEEFVKTLIVDEELTYEKFDVQSESINIGETEGIRVYPDGMSTNNECKENVIGIEGKHYHRSINIEKSRSGFNRSEAVYPDNINIEILVSLNTQPLVNSMMEGENELANINISIGTACNHRSNIVYEAPVVKCEVNEIYQNLHGFVDAYVGSETLIQQTNASTQTELFNEIKVREFHIASEDIPAGMLSVDLRDQRSELRYNEFANVRVRITSSGTPHGESYNETPQYEAGLLEEEYVEVVETDNGSSHKDISTQTQYNTEPVNETKGTNFPMCLYEINVGDVAVDGINVGDVAVDGINVGDVAVDEINVDVAVDERNRGTEITSTNMNMKKQTEFSQINLWFNCGNTQQVEICEEEDGSSPILRIPPERTNGSAIDTPTHINELYEEFPTEEIITRTELFPEYQNPEIEKETSVEVFMVPCPVETKINEFCKAEEVQIVSTNIPTEEVILKTELTPESAVEEGREFSEIKLRMIQEKTHKVAIMNHPPVDEIHINGFCEEKMDFVITEIPTEEIIARTELFPEYQTPEIEKEISVEVFMVPCPVETKINEFCKAEEVQIVSTNIPTEEVILKTELTPESAVEEGREFSEIKLRMIQEKTHKVAIMNHPPVDEIHINGFCEEEKVELVITEIPTEEIITRTELFPEYQNPEIEKEISVEVFKVPCPVETRINEFCKAEEVQIVSTNIPTEKVILKTELTPESAVEEGKEFSEIKPRMIQEKTHNIGITNHPPVDEIHNGFCEEEKMDLVTAEIPIEEIITKTDLFLEYQTPEIEKEISVEVFKVPCPVETKINEFCKAEEVQIVSTNIPTEEVILKTELTPESAVEEGREFSEIKLRMIQEKTHKVAIMNHPPVDEIHINGFCEEKMDFVITEIPTEEIIARTELFPEYQTPEIEKEISVEVFMVPCPVETKINEFCKAEEVQIVSTNIPTEEVILKTELTPESAVEEGREFSEIKLRMIQEKTHKVAIMNHPPVDEIHINGFCEEEKVELVITEIPTEEIITRTELFPEYQNPEIEKEISVEVFKVPCPVETRINEFCKAEEVQIVSTNIPTEKVILKTELTPESAVEEGKEFSEIKPRMIQEKTHNIGITNHPPVDEIHNGFCEEEKMDLVTAEIPIEEIITKTDLFLEYQTPEIEKEISVEVFKVPCPVETKINEFCKAEEVQIVSTNIPTEEVILKTELTPESAVEEGREFSEIKLRMIQEKTHKVAIMNHPPVDEIHINGFCEEKMDFVITEIPTEEIITRTELFSEYQNPEIEKEISVEVFMVPCPVETKINEFCKAEEVQIVSTNIPTEEVILKTELTPESAVEEGREFSEIKLRMIQEKTHKVAIMNHPPVDEIHINGFCEEKMDFVITEIPTEEIITRTELFPEYQNPEIEKEISVEVFMVPCPVETKINEFCKAEEVQIVSTNIPTEEVILKTELTPESAVEEGREFSEIKLRMIQEKTHKVAIMNHPPVDEIHINGFCEEKMDFVITEIPTKN